MSLQELPRDWMLADLGMMTAGRMKDLIGQAVQWGFDEPPGLTNNAMRIRFLRECREKAWTMLATGTDAPGPGRRQPDAPKRAAAPKKRSAPQKAAPKVEPSVLFRSAMVSSVTVPVRQGRGRRFPVIPDLCGITAAECNAFLRSLPPVPLYGEDTA